MHLLRGSHSGRNAGMPGMQRRAGGRSHRIQPDHTTERRTGGRKRDADYFIIPYCSGKVYADRTGVDGAGKTLLRRSAAADR